MTEDAKEKNHSLHNYVGTGTIRERYATTVDYLMYSLIFPIPNTNSALMWLPPKQCLRASTTIWIGFAISLSGLHTGTISGATLSGISCTQTNSYCSSEMIWPSSVNWRLSLNANTFEWGCCPRHNTGAYVLCGPQLASLLKIKVKQNRNIAWIFISKCHSCTSIN